MDLFSLITFWSFVVAAYSVFPPQTRARVKLFVSPEFTLSIFFGTSILSVLLILISNGYICSGQIVCDLSAKFSSSIIYILLTVYALIALWEIKSNRVSRNNIYRFKDSAEILYRKGLAVKQDPDGWSVLIDILNDNVNEIFEIASTRETLRKYWYIFWIRILMPKDKIILIFTEEKKEVNVELNVFDRLKKFLNENKVLDKFRRGIFDILTKHQVNTFYPQVPESTSTKTASEIIKSYFLDKELLKLSIKYKPDFIIRILSAAKRYNFEVEKTVGVCVEELLIDTESILYQEIVEFNVPDHWNTSNYDRSKFLSIFFSEDNFVDDSGIVTPILQYIYKYLKSHKKSESDDLNNAEVDVYSDHRFDNPIVAGVYLYDWIVRSALRKEIKWHMFLFEIGNWEKLILEKMTFTGSAWDEEREFPTPYYYMLYEMFDKFRDWFRFVEQSPDIRVYDLQGDIDKNGNALQFAVETLGVMVKNLGNSDMPEHYKIYLTDMLWQVYFQLLNSPRTELYAYGEHLLNSLFINLTRYSSPFDYKMFKLLMCSFYKVDIIGFHKSGVFSQSDEVKKRLLEVAGTEVFTYLRVNDYDALVKESVRLLSDGAYLSSDGIYIPSYFRSEKVVSFNDLGVNL